MAERLELLSKAYADYKACAQSPGSVNSKCQLNSLTEALQKQGIHGNHALQLLDSFKAQIGWQTMHPEEFRRFYQFVFFLCREQGKRNLQVPVAVAAWRGLLEGRFRLLERWCAYMVTQYKPLVVTEDTWVQLLEFSRTVHEDLSNYDPTAAWPVALDEFVEHLRQAAKKTPEPMDLTSSWPSEHQVLAAVSPRSGSKRRSSALGVAEAAEAVAEQLQHLPLTCSNHFEHQQQQLALQAGMQQPDKQRATHHVVKRYRVGAPAAPAAHAAHAAAPPQAQAQAQAQAAAAAAAGFRSPPAHPGNGQQRGCEACEGMTHGGFSSPGSRVMGGLHPMCKSTTAAAAAGGGSRGGWGSHCSPMQGDQAMAVDSSAGPFSYGAATHVPVPSAAAGGRAVPWGHGCQQQSMCPNNNMGGGQQHHMHQLMQATVTETLFYA